MEKLIKKFLSQKSLRKKRFLLALIVSPIKIGATWSGKIDR